MKITIINVANKMPSWIIDACDEYLQRINHGKYTCQLIEIKADKKNNKTTTENMAIDAKKIISHIPNNSFKVILDEHGKPYTSIKFAKTLEEISLTNNHITFIIGSADGIHQSLKELANLSVSLSNLTFPHALVRVIILEQIYRAITILENHPYHRE